MKFLALLLLIVLFFCIGCETSSEQRLANATKFVAERTRNCEQTLIYINHKGTRNWCLAGCVDGLEPTARYHVLVVPCQTTKNGE